MVFESNREFQLWDYSVSHKRMLVRSPSSLKISTNIDLVFWDVHYIELGTYLRGLSLEHASPEESSRLASQRGTAPLHRLQSGESQFFVAASFIWVYENELDIFESTLVDVSKDRPREWYGRVLYEWRAP